MIKLSNVSAKLVTPFGENYQVIKLIQEKKAKSVEDVMKLIEEHKEYDWDKIKRDCKHIQKMIEAANARGDKANIYNISNYEDSELEKQNEMNLGNILLLDNITQHRVQYVSLKHKTIKQIKEDLSYALPNGTNYLTSGYAGYYKIGESNLPKIVEAINMYEEQINRQALLTNNREINLFELDQKDKSYIVEEMYKDIVLYLVYNTDEKLIWGNLSDAQKRLYISSAINSNKQDIYIKNKLISYISNYTTLPELEKVADNDLKVLKRFIKK